MLTLDSRRRDRIVEREMRKVELKKRASLARELLPVHARRTE